MCICIRLNFFITLAHTLKLKFIYKFAGMYKVESDFDFFPTPLFDFFPKGIYKYIYRPLFGFDFFPPPTRGGKTQLYTSLLLLFAPNLLPLSANYIRFLLFVTSFYESLQGLDVNAMDSLGKTPLFWSVMHGIPDITRLLLEHGASIAEATLPTRSLLHWAAWQGNDDVIKCLLENGLNKGQMRDGKERVR